MRWEALPLACVFFCACGPDRSGSHPDGGSGADGGPDGGVAEEVCAPSEIAACTPANGSDGADGVIVRGTVIAPDRLICSGDVLYSRSRGTIECVDEDCSASPAAAGAKVVCADVITPGLIGAHEHDGYNTLPRFQHAGTLYGDKTDWQGNAGYRAYVDANDAIRTPYLCEIGKWAEVRHILGGATSLMGNQGGNGACLRTLARDLDVTDANGVYATSANYVAVMSFIDQGDAATIRSEMAEGLPFVIHVGEGVTQGWRYDEWSDLLGLDLLYPQTTIVHGTAFSAAQLADMGVLSADLAWSPRSNLDLYGLTTPVTIAHHLGSLVSLGTDWTPSGSMNLVEELRCADHLNRTYFDHTFSERQLLEMVTRNPARAFLIDDKVGGLASGLLADLAVFRGDRTRPFRAILDGRAGDVALVVIGGQAVYGDRALLVDQGLEPGASCEDLDVCGQRQRVCVKSADAGDPAKLDQTLAGIQSTLEAAIAAARPADCGTSCYAYELMPLFDCDAPDPAEVCTPILEGSPALPVSGDADGDRVADASDLCPHVFDPLFDGATVQGDLDGDGRGDACDVCPADADDGCTGGDADGDGVANVSDLCPLRRDASQTDEDADGLGDACDACPGDGDRACTSLRSVRDPRDPFHPNPGSPVHISGLVVTAVKSSTSKGRQLWVQEPAASEYGGIVVFYGTAALPAGIAEGQTVDVRGTYEEYFDLAEITSPTVTITNATPSPLAPIAVDPAMVATGGARAEALESMLVTVSGVSVMNASPDSPDRDEFLVSSNLRVDDLIIDGCDPGSTAAACSGVVKTWGMSVGSVYTITGVISYSFSNSKLLPRSKVTDFDPDAL